LTNTSRNLAEAIYSFYEYSIKRHNKKKLGEHHTSEHWPPVIIQSTSLKTTNRQSEELNSVSDSQAIIHATQAPHGTPALVSTMILKKQSLLRGQYKYHPKGLVNFQFYRKRIRATYPNEH
jgi:hypothetical protein